MMERDKISVIIPVFNIADYLPQCLNSIIQNTYENLEFALMTAAPTNP